MSNKNKFAILVGNNTFYGKFNTEQEGYEFLEKASGWIKDRQTGFYISPDQKRHAACVVYYPQVLEISRFPKKKVKRGARLQGS